MTLFKKKIIIDYLQGINGYWSLFIFYHTLFLSLDLSLILVVVLFLLSLSVSLIIYAVLHIFLSLVYLSVSSSHSLSAFSVSPNLSLSLPLSVCLSLFLSHTLSFRILWKYQLPLFNICITVMYELEVPIMLLAYQFFSKPLIFFLNLKQNISFAFIE